MASNNLTDRRMGTLGQNVEEINRQIAYINSSGEKFFHQQVHIDTDRCGTYAPYDKSFDMDVKSYFYWGPGCRFEIFAHRNINL